MPASPAEWDNHEQAAEHLRDETKIPGRGMGKIHPRFFEATTWAHKLDSAFEAHNYVKFVETMMNRIRFQESDPDEIRLFVSLIATDTNWKFMDLALPLIPELKDDQ